MAQDLIAPVDHIEFAVEKVLEHQASPWTMPFEGMDKSSEEVCQEFVQSKGQCSRGKLCPFRHNKGQDSVVCRHWLRALCKKGDDCEFFHTYDLSLMDVCRFYAKTGECNNPECVFRHVDPESSRKECAWYTRGFCKNGPHCRNRHLRRTMCLNYLCGFCPEGPKCKFAHPLWEQPSEFPGAPAAAASFPFSLSSSTSTAQTGIICRRCRQPGHKAPQCPLAGSEGGVVCHTCGTPGHKTPQCPQNEGARAAVLCYNCGERGHYASKCPSAPNT